MSAVISPVFNRMLSAEQVEDAVRDALKKWFPTYLHELERQLGVQPNTFVAPDNYSDRNSFDMESPEKLPKVVVIAPGLTGTPSKKGSWTYNATWKVGVGIAVGARTEDDANKLVKGYAAAIRGIMLQSSELDSIGALDIAWTDESYDDLPITLVNQLVKAASLYFDIEIGNVVTRGRGPTQPDEADYDYGQAQTVEVTLEKVEEVDNGS